MSSNHLGGALYAKSDYENAEPLIREAFAIRRKLLGDDHPQKQLFAFVTPPPIHDALFLLFSFCS